MTDPHKEAKARFEESREEFRKAHSEGMSGLRRGDLTSVDAAIALERDAIKKMSGAIDLARATRGTLPDNHVAAPSPTMQALHDEHAQLLDRMEALQREHQALQADPGDVEGHRSHRKRLQDQIAQLHAHMQRLRGTREG